MTNFKYFFIGLADYLLSVGKDLEPGPGVPAGPKPLQNFVLGWIPHAIAAVIILMAIALLLPSTAPVIAQNLPETPPGTGAWASLAIVLVVMGCTVYFLGLKLKRFYVKMVKRGQAIEEGRLTPAWKRASK